MDTQKQENWLKLREQMLNEDPSLRATELAEQIVMDGERLKAILSKAGKTKSEIDGWLALMG